MTLASFKREIYAYYKKSGRVLPWRHITDPYKVLVSEVMLQQTQVSRVLAKYASFIEQFPTVEALAGAPTRNVLAQWQGLGYNRRALYLKRTAQVIVREYNGHFPALPEQLETLPGIGPATARALAAFAFNYPDVFIETNIRSVYLHFFFPGAQNVPDRDLLALIEKTLDRKNPREWYYALFDYGVKLKKELPNPNRKSRHYTRQTQFEGSRRQLRGKILKILVKEKSILIGTVQARLGIEASVLNEVLGGMRRDGLITTTKQRISIV